MLTGRNNSADIQILAQRPILVWVTILVAALGYFVDVFDMWLFANFRIQSLTELGYDEKGVVDYGALLINCQQAGFLLGGVVWGTLGDKRGRASVMFGSIFLYSVCNILNAYVTNIEQYVVLRFITGFGLAGEIGAGITLVCEILPKTKRGLGTTVVATIGVSGALGAALAGKYLHWRDAFLLGGVMGFSLLLLRFLTHESGMFSNMKCQEDLKRGSLRLLFATRERSLKFLSCIAVGVPIYLAFGVFASFGPEIARAINLSSIPTVPDIMIYMSIGITGGDLFAGLLSQTLKSRKKPLALLMLGSCIISIIVFSGLVEYQGTFLTLMGLLGFCSGYWACMITTSAEQFGTNIRATVTTMIPNLVRASSMILVTGFVMLKEVMSIPSALAVLTAGTFGLAALGLYFLRESFHDDLDFFER